ncbi:MAG: nitroreductase family protein [Chloroflexota bacterium]
MEFFQVVKERCSTRKFIRQPVEAEKLRKVLETINSAPSAGNMQAYEVYVVNDPVRQAALSKASWDQESIVEAQVVLVFCTHPELNAERYGDRGRDLYALQDATIACTFAMLAVIAVGLACVWVGAFDDEQVWRIIGAPAGQTPVSMLPIGYPDKPAEPRTRRSLDSLIHRVG